MRTLGIVLSVLFGIPFLLLSWIALSSRFGGAEGDMHGYGLLFGTLLAMAFAAPVAFSVPLIFPKQKRGTAWLVSMLAFLVIEAGLFTALLTA